MAVQQALSTLTDRQREAVILRFYLDLSASETAHLLGSTPGAVRALTHRAMEQLRVSLDMKTPSRTSEVDDER